MYWLYQSVAISDREISLLFVAPQKDNFSQFGHTTSLIFSFYKDVLIAKNSSTLSADESGVVRRFIRHKTIQITKRLSVSKNNLNGPR